jgi:hypothetical protein
VIRFASPAIVALVFGGAFVVASPAQAQPESTSIACTGRQVATYSPALGPLPQDITVQIGERLGTNQDAGQCVGQVTGGHANKVIQEQGSCLIPPPAGTLVPPDVITYHWDSGGSSTVTYTVTTVSRVGAQTVVTSTGTVTNGLNQGHLAVREVTLIDLDITKCLAFGVTEQSGPMTLVID